MDLFRHRHERKLVMFRERSLKKNFVEGPLFFKIFTYAAPIMITSVLQIIYNMADNIVVGQFSGDPLALAAVGSTASLTGLIVNLLIGISGGTGVIVAQAYGAKHHDMVSRAVHTSVGFAFVGGIVFMAIGILVSRPALIWMDTKDELLDLATLYMRIVCCGIPASAIYNFSASSLRSVGDSKTPLLILSTSGVVNVALNVIFVVLFGMSVDGVALATIISQYASAVWVLLVLIRRKNECYNLNPKRIRIELPVLGRVLRFGIPAALQSTMFNISNMLITSAANVFPTTDLSAKTIVSNIDGICYCALNSYFHASMTVTAQNYGARKCDRIDKALVFSLLQVTVIGVLLGHLLLLFADPLASLYIDPADPSKEAVLASARKMLSLLLRTYFICGVMETFSGWLRGLGYSLMPTIVSVAGICGVRILWIYAFFPMDIFHSILGLYYCYPISWSATALIFIGMCVFARRRLKRAFPDLEDAEKNVDEVAA